MVIFGFLGYFGHFRGLGEGGYFAHFRGFGGIFLILWVLGVFWSFFRFRKHFGHFLGFYGILVIFWF